MTIVHRRIDNDLRSPTYLCEVEEVIATRPSRMPAWLIATVLLTLLAVGRIEDVAAWAGKLDQAVDWLVSR
jgi:uncharacterized membrane protein